MKGNIYLVGFMGSGKSTIGALLGHRLKRRFVDMDEVLERQFGHAIPQVFAERGEEVFRRSESALLRKLSQRDKLVVATGGGVVEREENRLVMQASGTMIHLDSSLDSCGLRLSPRDRATRPLWRDESALRNLFDRRRSLYARTRLVVSVDGKAPDEVADLIVEAVAPEERFSVWLGDVECPIAVTHRAGQALAEIVADRRAVVLTDSTVARLHLDRIIKDVKDPVLLTVRPGERSKSMNSARRIYEDLIEHRFDRDDVLVAVGGGVVTDLGAFVASTYKRGMQLVLVSTTLLGCVDAAVGGKAAINLGQAKNVVGCFSRPEAVILDVPSLRTLNGKLRREGLVEAYKTGLVASPDLADRIEGEAGALLAGDQALLMHVAAASARTKAHVVSQDYQESGLRRILNLGHTFGHAIEGINRFRISHGLAVAWGMRVAARLSEARKLISRDMTERIVTTVHRIYPSRVDLPPVDEALEIMSHDKKIRRGRLVFVLLEGIGRPICVDDVSRDELAAVLESLEEAGNG
jgi:shikimate kinase/3-dehydroquinate synthase